MTAKAATCPSQQLLADYGLGKLDNAESDTIHEHLETCAECRIIADRAPGDSFVIRLREAHAQPAIADAPGKAAGAGGTFRAGESVSNAARSSETPLPAGKQPASDGLSGPTNVPPELANHPDYEFLKELGRGGMGIVYLARNRMMDRLEVLKVVSKSLLERPGALERFQQEIRSAAKLGHPNIVAAYTVLRPGDLLVFAMEYVDGQDLSQVVKQRGPLPVTNATSYVQQVALGLQHAHDKGMVHRDIKPNNLMLAVVGKRHVVKILDFGLAKATSEKAADGGLTKSGQMMGTPDYIAPEQSLDAQKADIRADIYSLGCTLYYLLAGHTPFRGNSLYEILQAHHQTEARPLNLERPEVPAELAAIVSKMMAKDPAKRFQTPMEVAKALNPFFKAGAAAGQSGINRYLPPSAEASPSIPPVEAVPMAAVPVPLASATPARVPFAQPVSRVATPVNANPLDTLSDTGTAVTQRRPAAKRRRRSLGLPVAIGLLLVGVLVFGAVMFKFRTADGVVAIEVNEPNPEIFVDGNKATVTWGVGGKTAEITLPAGTRKIELKKDGFKALGETVELESGGRRVLVARLEPITTALPRTEDARKPAENPKRGQQSVDRPLPLEKDGRLPREGIAATAGARPGTTTAASISAPPPVVAPPPAEKQAPSSDLDRIATRKWVRLVDSKTVLSDPQKMRFQNGVLELDNTALLFPHINARDAIIRAQVLKLSGQNVALRLRGGAGYFSAFFNGHDREGGDFFGIGKSGKPYKGLADAHIGRKIQREEFVEMAFAAIGDTLTLYVDGTKILTVRNNDVASGSIHIGAFKGQGLFKNVEYQNLDKIGSQVPPSANAVSGAGILPAAAGGRFIPLFNGRDLTGWTGDTQGYVVEEGRLICLKNGGDLFTAKEYSDFDLRFEFKLTPGANHGLGVRCPLIGLPSSEGMEVQILDDLSEMYKDIKPWQRHGSIYGVVPAKLGHLRPVGEWNQQEVVCSGPHIAVILNGATIVDAELGNVVPMDGKLHPGLKRRQGHLGLLGHGARVEFRRVEFRKIEIKELSGVKAPGIAITDSIADQLAKALALYEEKVRALREPVLKALDRRDAGARTAGEKQLIDLITLQREAFEKRDEIPTAVSTTDYQRQLFAARARLETAYEAAVRGFTKAKLDAQAEEATRDLTSFRQHVPTPVVEFAGKRYKEFRQRLTWRQAQAKCAEMGGHLPIIATAAENQLVAALTKSQGYDATWLGATDEKVEGQWVWVNGTSLDYANWDSGQPNNWHSIEHYAVLLLSAGSTWRDHADDPPFKSGTLGFICQWD